MFNFKTILTQLCTAGAQNLPDNSFQKQISLRVNELSLAIAIINATVGIAAYFMTHNMWLLWGVYIEIMLTAIPIYLNHHAHYNGASMALFLIISAATFFFCCLLGKLAEVDLMIVVLVGCARFIFTNRRAQVIAYFVAVLVLVAVRLNQTRALIQPIEVGSTLKALLFWSAYLVVIFLVIAIFNWYGQINDSLREWAERENKNKDKLIANAAHEIKVSFKTVFAIIGILYKIEKSSGLKGFTDAINDLRAACKNATSLIDNVFEFERYQAGGKPLLREQLVDIRLVLNTILEVYRHLASEKKVTIELSVSELIPYHIVCDEMKLRQIVTNLLHNAIKFTHNGTITRIDVTVYDRELTISVSDCGDGVADDMRERMFEPLVTKNPHGLGLGLYIVRELVTAMRGSIAVSNNPTGGATVSVSWPLPGHEAYPMAAMRMQ